MKAQATRCALCSGTDCVGPFGWTVVARGGGNPDPTQDDVHVYKRDTPSDKEHFAEDLAPFTFPTRAEAIASGKAGNYAYKR